MNIGEEAYVRLFGETHSFLFKMTYSGKFKGYNGNVRRYGNEISFGLSKEWRGVSKDIQIGLLQHLLVKILKKKKVDSIEMDLYNNFMHNVHISVEKKHSDPLLDASFARVNETFFDGLVEKPNLLWGTMSYRKLACYEYGTDTISFSTIFKEADMDVIDYVMYHEMLHKHLKYKSKNGRSFYHTRQFREMENVFPNKEELEKKLSKLSRRARWKRRFM